MHLRSSSLAFAALVIAMVAPAHVFASDCEDAICFLGPQRATAGQEVEIGTTSTVDRIEVSYDADDRTSATYDPGAVDGFWPSDRRRRDAQEGFVWRVLPVPGGDEETLPGGEALVHVTAYRRLVVVGEADFRVRLRSAAGRVRIKPLGTGGTFRFTPRVQLDADLSIRLEGRRGGSGWEMLTAVSKRVADLEPEPQELERILRPAVVAAECQTMRRCRLVLVLELSVVHRGERYFVHSAAERKFVRLRDLRADLR